jgi:UDP-glucose-4-epimerase GalE
MRILVTGGAGYVGSVTVERLVSAGHDVTVLDNMATGHPGSVPGGVDLIAGSFGDEALMETVLGSRGIEAVVPCAARSLVGESMREPFLYYDQNVVGGLVLLEAMRRHGIGRIVFSSTAAVYGVPDTTPIPEDAPLRPINPYGETKRTFEGELAWYAAAYGLRPVSLRYFNVAGASEANGEVHDPETHLIPNVLMAAESGAPVTLFGVDYPTPDGTPVRDYIHVLDLADAHLAAEEATAPGDPRLDAGLLVCNLGSGGGFSVKEVVAACERVIGREIPQVVGPRREGDPPVLVARIDRAREVLGWAPRRWSLDEMIGSASAWRQANPRGYGHLDATSEAELQKSWVQPVPKHAGTIHLADYDPEWPRLYEREERRIREALGDAVVSVDHVGSTSVPGLPAKPVIDILLVVRDSSDEAAYVPAMEAAGYRLVIREPEWHEHRVFKGPDTNINLHTFSPGSGEIGRMVGFRDHLRRNDADRDLYHAEKRRLAAQVWEYVQHYADAKSEVVEGIIKRAGLAGPETPRG